MPCLGLMSGTFRLVLLSVEHQAWTDQLPLLVHRFFPECRPHLNSMSEPLCPVCWLLAQGLDLVVLKSDLFFRADLTGMGSENRFLTQSGLLLVVNGCSTLSLNTDPCDTLPPEITRICETGFPVSHQEGCKHEGGFCPWSWRNWESWRYVLQSWEVSFL